MDKIIVLTKEGLDRFKRDLMEDLDRFKHDLIEEIKESLGDRFKKNKWLKSADVRELFGVSDSTLQTMRINRTIPAYKLDSMWLYKYEEIIEILENGKI